MLFVAGPWDRNWSGSPAKAPGATSIHVAVTKCTLGAESHMSHQEPFLSGSRPASFAGAVLRDVMLSVRLDQPKLDVSFRVAVDPTASEAEPSDDEAPGRRFLGHVHVRSQATLRSS